MIVDTALKHHATGKVLNDYQKDELFEITGAIDDQRHIMNLILLSDKMAKCIKDREPKTRTDQLEMIRPVIIWLFRYPNYALTYKDGPLSPKRFKSLVAKLVNNFSKIFRERSGYGSLKGSIPPAIGVDKDAVINLLNDWNNNPKAVNLEQYK